ncbi:MAG TPA: ParA family protein [Thiobacillaceae bacterium]|nr:ParA family protein [Thiobacillaceae bacterium]HNU64541.1 ParA family protein [Thiobacillaceae bacterium]
MAVIAVFNQKGGVGKTTTCLNVAASLALLERRPLVVDLDPQAHVSLALGVRHLPAGVTTAAFFREQVPLDRLVRHLSGGMRLLPGHADLSKVDALLGSTAGVAGLLKKGLAESAARAEGPVLIDCAPSLGVLSLNALVAADRVLIPVTADYLSIQGLNRLDLALNVLEGPLKRRIERAVVLTRFDEGRPQCREALASLKQRYGLRLCESRVTDDPALAESPAHGLDIFTYATESAGAHDYRLLTMELLSKGFFQ